MKKALKTILWGLAPWAQRASLFAVIITGSLAGSFALTSRAFAFPMPNNLDYGDIPAAISTSGSITAIVCGVVVWIFWGLIIFSIIMFFVGGYKYATAQGEPERVQSANKTLLYAAIAVVVALVAAGVPAVVSDFLSGGGNIDVCL